MTKTITPEMINDGDVYVEVYPMLRESDTMSRLIEAGEEPDFYDVWLRPDDWDLNNGSSFEEYEDLDWQAANERVAELERRYPGISVNWVNE